MAKFPELLVKAWATVGQKMGWGPHCRWGLPSRQADALFEKSQNKNVEFPFKGKYKDIKM